jgi:hypothetical protein
VLGSTIGGSDGSGVGVTVRPKTPVAATATAERRTAAARMAGTVREVVERDIGVDSFGSMSLGWAGIRLLRIGTFGRVAHERQK